MEVEFKSDMNTETGSMPYYDVAERYGNEILDAKLGNTDMKVRHVFKKFVEVSISPSRSTHACDILVIFLRASMSGTIIVILVLLLGSKQLHGNIRR